MNKFNKRKVQRDRGELELLRAYEAEKELKRDIFIFVVAAFLMVYIWWEVITK